MRVQENRRHGRRGAAVDGDDVLWARLRQDGFGGRSWDVVSDRLARYGYQCIGAWVRAGVIFAKCWESGARGLSEADLDALARMSAEDVEELVQDAVAKGLSNLQTRARNGEGWRDGAGRSLETYFITSCLLAFPTIYRGHCRKRRRWASADLAVAEHARDPRDGGDVAAAVVHRDELHRLLAGIGDPGLRTAVFLSALGYPCREIAPMLPAGTTARQVEDMLRAYKRRREEADRES
jgi:DNA-directed RNA polymerase specialized sigma24 family protein